MKSCPLAVKCGFYHTSQYNPDTEEQKSDMKFSSDGNLTLHGASCIIKNVDVEIENTSEYNKTTDWQVSKNLIEQRGIYNEV